MKLVEYFAHKENNPLGPGWRRQWHGLSRPPAVDFYQGGDLERFVFCAILQQYRGKRMTMFEIGAGRADWTCALAGLIRHGGIPNTPVSYRALAVEAQPEHYEWSKLAIERQEVVADVVHAAVGDHEGTTFFRNEIPAAIWFGQQVLSEERPQSIEVPMTTIEALREGYDFAHIDLVHVDCEGCEVAAVRGADLETTSWWLIETHVPAHHDQLIELLQETHKLEVELRHDGKLEHPDLSKPVYGMHDRRGLMAWSPR